MPIPRFQGKPRMPTTIWCVVVAGAVLVSGCLEIGFERSAEANGNGPEPGATPPNGMAGASDDPVHAFTWATDAWRQKDVALLIHLEVTETPDVDDWRDCSLTFTASGRSTAAPQWTHFIHVAVLDGQPSGWSSGGGGGFERFVRAQAPGVDTHEVLTGALPAFEWWSSRAQTGMREAGNYTFFVAAARLDLIQDGFDPDHTIKVQAECPQPFIVRDVAVSFELALFDSRMADNGTGASSHGILLAPATAAVLEAEYAVELGDDVALFFYTPGGIQKTALTIDHPEGTESMEVDPLDGPEVLWWMNGSAGRHRITVDHHAGIGATPATGSGYYYGGILAASWTHARNLPQLSEDTF